MSEGNGGLFGRIGAMFGGGEPADEEAVARLQKSLSMSSNRKRLLNLLKAWCTDAGGIVQLSGAPHLPDP